MLYGMAKSYIRAGIYDIDTVLQEIVDNQYINHLRRTLLGKGFSKAIVKKLVAQARLRWWAGHPVRMNSQRYHLFAQKGCQCVQCGITGAYFALEKDPYSSSDLFHFNLYGLRDDDEIMITKDHIIPRAKGGANKLTNYQPMCSPCNNAKADSMPLQP